MRGTKEEEDEMTRLISWGPNRGRERERERFWASKHRPLTKLVSEAREIGLRMRIEGWWSEVGKREKAALSKKQSSLRSVLIAPEPPDAALQSQQSNKLTPVSPSSLVSNHHDDPKVPFHTYDLVRQAFSFKKATFDFEWLHFSLPIFCFYASSSYYAGIIISTVYYL